MRKTLWICLLVSVVMFAFCFAIVPFYSAICRATGLNTSEPIRFQPAPNLAATPDLSRDITVQLLAVTNANLPWDFYPLHASIHVHPGDNAHVLFYAKNKTHHTMIVQAIPSMLPSLAVAHFHKIECFCFRQQILKADESIRMPLVFRIDKDIPPSVNTISLAYTLFDMTHSKKRISL